MLQPRIRPASTKSMPAKIMTMLLHPQPGYAPYGPLG